MIQGLIDAQYLDDPLIAQKLLWILNLPHFHHHEKRSVMKTASSISLTKQGIHQSASFVMNNLSRRGQLKRKIETFFKCFLLEDDESDQTQEMTAIRLISKPSSADMTLNEQEESGGTSNTPTAKVKT